MSLNDNNSVSKLFQKKRVSQNLHHQSNQRSSYSPQSLLFTDGTFVFSHKAPLEFGFLVKCKIIGLRMRRAETCGRKVVGVCGSQVYRIYLEIILTREEAVFIEIYRT